MPTIITNEYLDNILQIKNIKRIGNYINCHSNIKIKCNICNHNWRPLPTSLIHKRSGCPNCGGTLPLTNIIIDDLLKNKNIKRIDNYINGQTSIKFQCLNKNCFRIWSTKPYNIINRGSGCVKCSGKLKLTNEIVDEKLKGRNVKRIGEYKNIHTKINFLCLVCYLEWEAEPNSVINVGTGCVFCKIGKNEKMIKELFIQNNIEFHGQKYIKKINTNEKSNIRVDFYFDKLRLIIEYNGSQHYKPEKFNNVSLEVAIKNFEKQQIRDKYLANFCLDNNIKLISIDGRRYHNKKLEKYIKNEIIPNLGS